MLSLRTLTTISYTETLRAHAHAHPDRRALIFLQDGERETASLTYSALDAHARALAARLHRLELTGERALLLFPSGLEFVIGFLGCLYAGVVAVPAPAPEPGRLDRLTHRLRTLAQDSGARVVLTSASIPPFAPDPRDGFSGLDKMQVLMVGLDEPDAPTDWHPPSITSETPAFLQYTSGSTGDPKGVVVTQGNLVFNQRLIEAAFGHDESSTIVGWLPLFHDMGLIGNLLQPLFVGGMSVLMPPEAFLTRPARWLQAISRYRAPVAGGPDFAYALCTRKVRDAELQGLDLSSWRLAFNGAEPVRPKTLEQFSERFAACGFRRQAFYPCYGLAEATLMVTGGDHGRSPTVLNLQAQALETGRLQVSTVESPESLESSASADSGQRSAVSSGRAWGGQEVVIIDPYTRKCCPESGVGEIWVRGPGVAQGYWNRPEESTSTFRATRADTGEGPYLRTGDLGALHGGELYVVGRLKDLIILRGRNLHPTDLEQAIELCHPSVRPGASAAFSIELEGEERLMVAVELDSKRDPVNLAADPTAVEYAVRECVARQFGAKVHTVFLLPLQSLPRTSSGKLRRQACRKSALAGTWGPLLKNSTLNASSPHAADPQLEALLRNALARALQIDEKGLRSDRSLAAHGLDSLSGIELRDHLEQRLGIEVPLELLTGDITLLALADTLAHRMSPDGLRLAVRPGTGTDVAHSPQTLATLQQRLESYEAVRRRGIPTHGTRPQPGVISLMSNDYLSLSGDSRIVAAQIDALQSETRDVFMSGVFLDDTSAQRSLEREFAQFFGAEDAALCQSGWSANDGLLQALVDPATPVYLDVMAHMSMWQGVRNAGAIPRSFRHNQPESLEALIRRHGPGIILVDSVYSAHGDVCPLKQFVEVAERSGSLLVVDESHGAGVFGPHGEGVCVAEGLAARVPLRTISLSKAFISRAGLVVGSTRWINYFRHSSRPAIFSSAVTAHEIAGFRATLEVIRQDDWRRSRLLSNSQRLRSSLLELGYPLAAAGTQIISLEGGPEAQTVALRQALEHHGVLGAVFCAPATPVNRSLVRFSVNAGLTDTQLQQVIDACRSARRILLPAARDLTALAKLAPAVPPLEDSPHTRSAMQTTPENPVIDGWHSSLLPAHRG